MKNPQVLVVGSGLVGVIVGCVLSKYCSVTIYDKDRSRIEAWMERNPPFYEPGLEDLVEDSDVQFTASSECINAADIIILCINYSAASNLDDTLNLFHQECRTPSRKIIIEKSTLPLNTSEHIRHSLRNHPAHFDILSIPEFLSQGTAIQDSLSPDRVLIGCDMSEGGLRAQKTLIDVYAKWVPRSKILTQSIWSTELSKLASNALLAQRISSINSFIAICDTSGASITQLTQSLSTDRRIGGEYLSPSLAFGGSCLEKDLQLLVYLCEALNLHHVAQYWKCVIEMNDYQLHKFIKRVTEAVEGIEHPKIAVLGWVELLRSRLISHTHPRLAFKKDTGDLRLSPSIRVIKKLLKEHRSIHFSVYDPVVTPSQISHEFESREGIEVCQSIYKAATNSHCVLLLTNWEEFYTQIDWNAIYQKMKSPRWVLDGHLIVDVGQLQSMGYNVYQIGY